MTGGDSSLQDSVDCLTVTRYWMVSLPPQEVVATQDQVPVSDTRVLVTTSVLL